MPQFYWFARFFFDNTQIPNGTSQLNDVHFSDSIYKLIGFYADIFHSTGWKWLCCQKYKFQLLFSRYLVGSFLMAFSISDVEHERVNLRLSSDFLVLLFFILFLFITLTSKIVAVCYCCYRYWNLAFYFFYNVSYFEWHRSTSSRNHIQFA